MFRKMCFAYLIYSFFLFLQMALDAKAIKEEIPDKDTYDINSRRTKGKFKILLYLFF